MITGRTVEAKGSLAGGQMTLADVTEFAATLRDAGAANDCPVTATVGWGGRLKSLKATAGAAAGKAER